MRDGDEEGDGKRLRERFGNEQGSYYQIEGSRVVEWRGGVDRSLGLVGQSVVWWDMVRCGRCRRKRLLVSGPGGSVMGILMRQT